MYYSAKTNLIGFQNDVMNSNDVTCSGRTLWTPKISFLDRFDTDVSVTRCGETFAA